ncbi:hypothetical protein HELRODRAFT_181886 [Helobdella robusta]|uniref:Uncharacterized protein n=1 Tax=Helobdella robusta TaxID=6412 RepID=T1FHF5_HELRO|nr:hypothetical protein HELRODRAFT_181886 [Helobdella robusta]ESN91962.1 hypothetical protein HELRODRAFT_181886 [Helobdella robusta]
MFQISSDHVSEFSNKTVTIPTNISLPLDLTETIPKFENRSVNVTTTSAKDDVYCDNSGEDFNSSDSMSSVNDMIYYIAIAFASILLVVMMSGVVSSIIYFYVIRDSKIFPEITSRSNYRNVSKWSVASKNQKV